MRNISLTLCLTLAALAAGCSNAPATMPDTRTADIQAVKDVEAAWLKDTDSKDPEKWASYFADDGSGLYPGMGIVTGRAALKTAMTPFFADPNFKLSFQSTRAVASKRRGYGLLAGHLHLEYDRSENQEADDGQGKVSDDLHEAGGWQLEGHCRHVQFRFRHVAFRAVGDGPPATGQYFRGWKTGSGSHTEAFPGGRDQLSGAGDARLMGRETGDFGERKIKPRGQRGGRKFALDVVGFSL